MKRNYLYTIKRALLFEYISAIELDLRAFILERNIPLESYDEIISERITKELTHFDYDFLEMNRVHYLDFGDYVQIIAKYAKFNKYDNTIIQKLEKLIPIRNRIMHSRPLVVDDDELVDEFVEDVIPSQNFISFHNVENVKNLVKSNPNLFYERVPDFSRFYIKKLVENNLPLVDFDDTGFVGREEKKNQLRKKIMSAYPVISVIGVGGIGKTATVLSCIYDWIDDESFPFEKVLWVTLKTKALQDGDFKDIKNSLKSFSECIEKNPVLNKEKVTYIDELLFYMSAFKTLLILDNLETINTNDIKELLENIPQGSKILITSRIGIGEYETRFELGQFDESEALSYLRKLIKSYDVKILSKTSDCDAKKYVKKMFYSPLCIKWFVINVGKGNSPEIVASDTEQIVEFCLSNVYEKLSEEAKYVLKIIFISQKNCSLAEIIYLNSDQSENAYKSSIQSINELKRCNFIEQMSYVLFGIPEFSSLYLRNIINRSDPDYKIIEQNINKLYGLLDNITKNSNVTADIKPFSLFPKTSDEKIATIYMFKFIDFYNNEDIRNMDEMFDAASKAAPKFSDLYKVSGYYYGKIHSKEKATTCFKSAIEYADETIKPYVSTYYAVFLLSEVREVESALAILTRAVNTVPDDPRILAQFGRALKYNKHHKQAYEVFEKLINGDYDVDSSMKRMLYSEFVDSKARYINENLTLDSEKTNLYIDLISFIEKIDKIYYSVSLYKTFYKILKNMLYIRNNIVFSERALKYFNSFRQYILFVAKQEDVEELVNNLNKYWDANYSFKEDEMKITIRECGFVERLDRKNKCGYICIKGRNDLLRFSLNDSPISEQNLQNGTKLSFDIYCEKGEWKAVNIENAYIDYDD